MDIKNIIEIQQIRQLLINEPLLLSFFELLIIMINEKISYRVEDEIETEDSEEEETNIDYLSD
jgi:hypothetical protein